MNIIHKEREAQSYFITDQYETEKISNLDDLFSVFDILERENKKVANISILFEHDHTSDIPSLEYSTFEEMKSSETIKKIDVNDIELIQFALLLEENAEKAYFSPKRQRLSILSYDMERLDKIMKTYEELKANNTIITHENMDEIYKKTNF